MIKAGSVILLCLAPLAASAQDISGALRFNYANSSKLLDDENNFYGATAQAKWLPTFSQAVDGKFEARATNPNIASGGTGRASLLEGYVTVHGERTDLRIGKQVIAWGRADGINPTDNLTPRDYTVLLPFEDDQRLGTTAFKLNHYVTAEDTVTVFATPWFEPSKLPGTAPAGTTLVEKKPAHTLANSEIGVKYDKTGGGLDWSASYFHGYSLLPETHLVTPAPLVLELRYPKINVLGMDMAQNFGRYGMRLEAAYIMPQAALDALSMQPYWFYVVGVDRTFFDNLNVNLQLIGRRVQNFADPAALTDPLLRNLAVQNAITFGQQDRESYGISSRIGDKWLNDTLEAEILLFANTTRRDSYIRPQLRYAFNDQVKSTVGAEIYSGADDTSFGRLKRNRNVFFETQYSF